MNSKWEIYRIGLIDFWYYDEEEFHFLDGRMLLRGSNGSGKSVTMQSFIPLLLDGNKASERLDPFGSKARKIENYLLEESDDREERTGYLYIEFKREESNTFITIGIGLRARKNKKLDSWYFHISDGRRVGKDFLLYKDVEHKITLSKMELRNKISGGGEVFDSQKDYMEFVNRQLFGFDTTEEYKELINLLIQLRTPKLSKDFKPTVINEILSNSLQTLSEDDLRPLSEAIENMDAQKTSLENMLEGKKAADKIKGVYQEYNRTLLLEKAELYVENKNKLRLFEKEEKEFEKKREKLQKDKAEMDVLEQRLYEEENVLSEQKRDLEKNDAVALKEKAMELERELRVQKEELQIRNKSLDDKKQKRNELEAAQKKESGEKETKLGEIELCLEEMEECLEEVSFDEHAFMKEEFKGHISENYSFSTIQQMADKLLGEILKGIDDLREQERMEKEYDEALAEYEDQKKERDNLERLLSHLGIQLGEIKNELIEKIYRWSQKNRELKPDSEILKEFTAYINRYNENSEFSYIREKVRDIKARILAEYQRKAIKTEGRLKEITQLEQDKAAELYDWENKMDPEPEKSEVVRKNRAWLDSEKIPYFPFYKVVDFGGGISEERANYLEEALLHMGILDALIIPCHFKEKVLRGSEGACDKYIFGDVNKVQENILSLFDIDNEVNDIIFYQEISNILKAVGVVSGEGTYLEPYGSYGIGIIKGTISKAYQAKYIGVKARAKYKEEMICTLKAELQKVRLQKEAVLSELSGYEKAQITLEEEFCGLPNSVDLDVARKEYLGTQTKLESILLEVEKKEKKANEIHKNLVEIKRRVAEICSRLYVSPDIQVFFSAKEGMEGYLRYLRDLQLHHANYIHFCINLNSIEERIDSLDADMDDILYQINRLNIKDRELSEKLSKCLEQLKLTNYEQIKEQLDHCILRLQQLPGEIKAAIQKSSDLKNNIFNIMRGREENFTRLGKQKDLLRLMERAFLDEYKLDYVVTKEEQTDQETEYVAKATIASLEPYRSSKDSTTLQMSLQERFLSNKGDLVEYHISMNELFGSEDYEGYNADFNVGRFKRIDLVGKYQGRQVDFLTLLRNLEQDIEVQRDILNDSDRELFEEILTNTISKKIRSRIYTSEDWVSKMNHLMGSMNTSSGLKLSLRWKKKKAETEDQLDTDDLVELLKKDSELMREEEFKKLSDHFRSKIYEARRILEDTGNVQSFHGIMRDVLDYRKWFEFQLYFKKAGENVRELTNSAFFTFSGGEKAMSMYVPLFSAVVAKYQGARPDAPRLISLDEAFAGVDEMNIKDMFRLMVECEFEFMINSQILWGDYDTVPKLAIYQLVRPENAKFVTVIPYVWNGEKKLIVDKIEEAV